MVLIVCTDIVLFLVCSYGLSKFGYESEFVDDDALISASAGTAPANLTATNTTGVAPVATPDVAVPVEATGRLGFVTACIIGGIITMVSHLSVQRCTARG